MATIHPTEKTGDISTFNIQHGFAEALIRGMRSSFLADADYHHLTQCETLDDVKLNLTETDYSEATADFNTMTPNILQKAAVNKVSLVDFVWRMTSCSRLVKTKTRRNAIILLLVQAFTRGCPTLQAYLLFIPYPVFSRSFSWLLNLSTLGHKL